MKKLHLFAFLLFLVPVITFSQAGPKFTVDGGDQINTGTYMRGNPVKYEIKFKNDGDAELKIQSVSTSCGCSTALVSSDALKPGETGTISFNFNGNGFGVVSKSVNVLTNEAAGSNMHSIVLSMNMVDPVNLSPNSIMTDGNVGDELTQQVKVSNFYDKEITLIEITSNSPAVKVTSDKMSIAVGDSAILSISIKLYEDSEVNAAVLIKSSQGDFQIPVLVTIRPKK